MGEGKRTYGEVIFLHFIQTSKMSRSVGCRKYNIMLIAATMKSVQREISKNFIVNQNGIINLFK